MDIKEDYPFDESVCICFFCHLCIYVFTGVKGVQSFLLVCYVITLFESFLIVISPPPPSGLKFEDLTKYVHLNISISDGGKLPHGFF